MKSARHQLIIGILPAVKAGPANEELSKRHQISDFLETFGRNFTLAGSHMRPETSGGMDFYPGESWKTGAGIVKRND